MWTDDLEELPLDLEAGHVSARFKGVFHDSALIHFAPIQVLVPLLRISVTPGGYSSTDSNNELFQLDASSWERGTATLAATWVKEDNLGR